LTTANSSVGFLLLINTNYMKIMRSIQNLSFSYPMSKNMKLTIGYLCEDSQTILSNICSMQKINMEGKSFLKCVWCFWKTYSN
jgi:hypothetical protein